MIYLAGPIDYGDPKTEQWRGIAARYLRELGCGCFDPYAAKHVGVMHEINVKVDDPRYFSAFAHVDVEAVRRCTGLLAGLFKDIKTVGTYVEIGIALGLNKPIVLWVPDGRTWLSDFLKGLELTTFTKGLKDASYYIAKATQEWVPGRREE